ncbi:MAG: lipid-binding protein [Bacteroidota bacterium]|nr:lipid-binding protein [Bacteroidota bacterium]
MKKLIKYSFLILVVAVFGACELYPDWNDYVEFDPTYPVSGEYIVNDYTDTGDLMDEAYGSYTIYIYNKANNEADGSDSIWIDNKVGHGASNYAFKYKIKSKADMSNLAFNCTEQGNVTGLNVNPLDSAATVTITNSKVFDNSDGIEDATADSIFFEVEYSYYNSSDVLVTETFQTAGHRKTGWENPNYDDDM